MVTVTAVLLPAKGASFPTCRIWTSNALRIDITRWSREWWLEIFDEPTGLLVRKNIVSRSGFSFYSLARLGLSLVRGGHYVR